MHSNQYWKNIQKIADSAKWHEQISAKAGILEKLFLSLNIRPDNILILGFNPVVLELENVYKCTVVADPELKQQWQSSSEFVSNLSQLKTTYSVCLALDEYFTYTETETEQRDILSDLSKHLRGTLITTLQDYKNTAPHKRNHIDSIVNFTSNNVICLEQHVQDKNSRQNWQTYIYFIEDHEKLQVLGPVNRRTMYFKQLAKYSSDLGASNYVIQKNLLYRGFFKRYFEHMITVRFN